MVMEAKLKVESKKREELSSRDEAKKKTCDSPSGPLQTVLKQSDWMDMLLMALGIMGSVVDGSSIAIIMIILSDLMNRYGVTSVAIEAINEGAALALTYVAVVVASGSFLGIESGAVLIKYLKGKNKRFPLQGLYYFGIMGETLTERVREAIFEKTLTFEIEWFDQENNSSGAICARLATDAVMMRTLVTARLSLLTQAVSSATLAVVLAFKLSWRLALVAIALEPGVIAAIYLREMTMRKMSKKTLKAQSASSALASEVAGNHKIITAFGSQGKVVKLYDRPQVSSRKESNRQSWYAGTTSGGKEFKQVYFIYPARPKQIILRGMDLKIEASKIVALVGRSGSGKSTTIRFIERFYDTLSSSIEVDGINIMCYNLRALRSHIALVSQEPTLFAGTSRRDNIAYAKENATEAEIIEAATIANAHGFISYMKDGYKTYCGEEGVQLSGGQKQRIALARAILKNPAILLYKIMSICSGCCFNYLSFSCVLFCICNVVSDFS